MQTLSRLNRIATGKEDTFVLDFVNEPDEIYRSFKPYYIQTAQGPDSDPHQLYRLQHQLQEYKVFTPEEVNAFCDIWFTNANEPSPGDHKRMNAIIDQAVLRFDTLNEEHKEEFKSNVVGFRNLYAFLSQIIPYQDSELEKLYTYLRFLYTKLPRRTLSHYVLDDDVMLKYYRLQKISEGSIDLAVGEPSALLGPSDVGSGRINDETVRLSTLVNLLNERFGTEFTPADQLFFDQVIETAISNEKIKEAAKVNTLDNFMYFFEKMLESLFIERLEGNEEIFTRLMNDEKMMKVASRQVGKDVWERLRKSN